MTNQYLFLLGRNPTLSRTELLNFCDEVWCDEKSQLMIGENLRFENPRDLPKTLDQLFLDRLGGCIRMGKIIQEVKSAKELIALITQKILEQKPEGKVHLGISYFRTHTSTGKSVGTKELLSQIKSELRNKHDRNCRIVNASGAPMDSGKIFGEKLLKKGFEFIIVQHQNTFLLVQTTANQNLWNYTIRDREKQFRDAHLGMLPPKLAQILINLASPKPTDQIIDPFCGTGTVNIEAAIMGYQTIGSDVNQRCVTESKKNFEQIAERFRYPKKSGSFISSSIEKFPPHKFNGIIATEGFLGENYAKGLSDEKISANRKKILDLWVLALKHFSASNIHTIVCCLPAWLKHKKVISIAEDLFRKTKSNPYKPQPIFNGKKSILYNRPGAFVAREIVVFKKS